MSHRPTPKSRSHYRHFLDIQTRWSDNDAYGHINNVVYYGYFDTVVNEYLLRHCVLDIGRGEVLGMVVETHCNFFTALAFPQLLEAGMRVAHIGASSVRYEIGIFAAGASVCAAAGHFIHVYVERNSRRPVALPAPLRAVLEELHS